MSGQLNFVIGTHFHPGGGDVQRRQQMCQESLRRLTGTCLVNLQFPDGWRMDVEGFETAAILRTDSIKASGRKGVRKPVVSELCDRLAEQARTRGAAYFCALNSDIVVSPALLERVLATPADVCIFSRMDFSAETGQDLGMFSGGQDCFVFRTAWWFANRARFRPYVIGEAFWDNIFTAVALAHGRAVLFNRAGLIRHEEHPRVWRESPFASYNRYLASLDTLYLDLWHAYLRRLAELRAAGASEAEESALQRECFRFQPSAAARLWQKGRSLKAFLRYRTEGIRRRFRPT